MDPDQGAMDHSQGAMALDQSAAGPDLTPFTQLSEDAQKELRDNCKKQLEQLELLQDEILMMSGETPPESVNRLIESELLLTATLNSQTHLSSNHPEVLREARNEEMERLCSELEMVLSWNTHKKEKLSKDCERELKELEEKHGFYKAAVARIEQIRKDKQSQSTKKWLQVLQGKLGKLSHYHGKMVDIMLDVVEEHFQLTDDQTGLLPLETILELLMNKFLQTPHDAYVTIDETFWPAHIETLLRYGIAVRHPVDNFKIRLDDF